MLKSLRIQTSFHSMMRALIVSFILPLLFVQLAEPCSAAPKNPGLPQYIKNAFNTVEYRRQFVAIEKIVALGPRYIPALIKRLGDESHRFRFCSIQALGKHGEAALPALKRALKSDRRYVRAGALKALGLMGKTARPLVPVILRRLNSKDEGVFFEASRAIPRIGLSERQKIEFLALFRSGKPRILLGLCLVVQRIGRQLPERVDSQLAKILASREGVRLRQEAAKALSARKASPAIRKALSLALRDKERSIRLEACRTLILLAEQDAKVIEPLLRHFQKCSSEEKLEIAGLLSEGGQRALALTEKILTEEKDAVVVAEAVSSLSIGGPKAEKLLERALQHSSEGVQRRAVFIAAVGGERGRIFAPFVLAMLRSKPSDELKQCCYWYFGQVKAKGPEVLWLLIKAADRGSLALRSSAVEALGNLGVVDVKVVEVLERALKDNDITLRERAKTSLEALRKG